MRQKRGQDPYSTPIVFTKIGETEKREMEGQLVAVLGLASDERGLVLIPQQARVLCKNEIHELVTTDEAEAGSGKRVDRVGVIGFFEVNQGGYVSMGDSISIQDKKIGKVAGFDETHFPNHYNIVVITPKRFSGLEASFQIGDKLSIGRE